MTKGGLIITNNHVIKDAKHIQIDFSIANMKHSYTAKVVKTDTELDLAILQISEPKFELLSNPPFSVKTKGVSIGQDVFALGFPHALGIMGEEIKYTDGTVSSKNGYRDNITTFQTTTPFQPGNSGGPLFDKSGRCAPNHQLP